MFQITLLDHLRLSFGGVVHDYYAHSEIAARLNRRAWYLRIAELTLLGGALAANITALVRLNPRWAVLSGVLVGMALALFAVFVALNLESRIYAHRWCASRLWLVREKYRALLSEIRDGTLGPEDIRDRRNELTAELHSIVQHAPAADRPAYLSARETLKAAEDRALTDDEIDAFLPESLRSTATPPQSAQTH
jgi:hypothetical protein